MRSNPLFKHQFRDFIAGQWSGFCAPTAGGMGLILMGKHDLTNLVAMPKTNKKKTNHQVINNSLAMHYWYKPRRLPQMLGEFQVPVKRILHILNQKGLNTFLKKPGVSVSVK